MQRTKTHPADLKPFPLAWGAASAWSSCALARGEGHSFSPCDLKAEHSLFRCRQQVRQQNPMVIVFNRLKWQWTNAKTHGTDLHPSPRGISAASLWSPWDSLGSPWALKAGKQNLYSIVDRRSINTASNRLQSPTGLVSTQ